MIFQLWNGYILRTAASELEGGRRSAEIGRRSSTPAAHPTRRICRCSMLDSLRTFIATDEHEADQPKAEDPNQSRVFNGFRTRAANALPNINLASLRSRAFGPSSLRDDTSSPKSDVSPGERTSRASDADGESRGTLSRRRSASMPTDRQRLSLLSRATMVKNMAILDLRARANALDFRRLPSFHFSLPFSDSSSHIDARDSPFDKILEMQQADSDNVSLNSLTSLEIESLATNMKAENNRLRGLIEGLPHLQIGIPGVSPPKESFAGLSEATKDVSIVILGGYRGSVLRSAHDRRMLWIPVKVGLGIRKVNRKVPC